jgi:hypothetical protein
MAMAYCDFGLANPGLYQVMFASPLPPVADLTQIPGRSAFEQRTAAIAVALGARGDPHDQDRSAFRASVLLWQLLHGTVNLRISRPLFPWPPLADTVTTGVNLILDDAAGRPGAAS